MSGIEFEIRDGESTVESDAQPVQLGLTEMEIEFLETLIGVSTRVEDSKRAKYSVDVRRVGNSIFFTSYTLQGALSVYFRYDFDQQKVLNLRGTDLLGVKNFLLKYRILED